tara:strand:+ start:2678 stop:4279 length:1602 start_codon:yes stop_codon:yes gene_type:complete
MTQIANVSTPDTRWGDPIAIHPGNPRWIFFDDIPPSREERQARAELIAASERECALRDPDWVDPEIDRYHHRMAVRRYALWLRDHLRSERQDTRLRLVCALAHVQLSPNSIQNRIRVALSEFLSPIRAKIAGSKLSFMRALTTALQKPEVPIYEKKSHIRKDRITFRKERYGSFCMLERDVEVKITDRLQKTERVRDPLANSQLNQWTEIHRAMGYPLRELDEEYEPSLRTLYCNPDGSRYLNTMEREKSLMAAKAAFQDKHNLPSEAVLARKVHQIEWNEEWLRRHNKTAAEMGNHYIVCCERKQKHLTPSSYYDKNPFIYESIDADGNTVMVYGYTGNRLYRVPPEPILPEGSYRLTVSDYERAIISGATLAEDTVDDYGYEYENLEEHSDDRERSSDNLPHVRSLALPEDMQLLHGFLVHAEMYAFAEMLTIQWTKAPKEDSQATEHHFLKGAAPRYDTGEREVSILESEVAATIYNDLQPRFDNPNWVQLRNHILTTVLSPGMGIKIVRSIRTLINSLSESGRSAPAGE